MDIFDDHVDPKRDLLRERKIEVSDAPAFIISQHDPYGFWSVRRERGQVPEVLAGQYTTYPLAAEAIEVYLATKAPKNKAA